MIISFSKTLEPLLAHKKCVSRRAWSDDHFKLCCTQYDNHLRLHKAYSHTPRAGGTLVGFIYLTQRPYREPLGFIRCLARNGELEKEGGLWKTADDFINQQFFGGSGYEKEQKEVVVLHFDFITKQDIGRCSNYD